MTLKGPSSPAKNPGKELLLAFRDLCILALLWAGAGFGGYFWGIHERLAPVRTVPPGTPGAPPPPVVAPPLTATLTGTATQTGTAPAAQPGTGTTTPASQPAGTPTPETPAANPPASSAVSVSHAPAAKAHAKLKYWITSSGTDYIGYSVTVKVNDTPVDNFFGPGKLMDITRLVKAGNNTVVYEAKALGDQYNKHAGDAKAALVLELVSGPHVQEQFKPADVIHTYKRTAAENQDFTDSVSFTGD
jgi:hypothetical protein